MAIIKDDPILASDYNELTSAKVTYSQDHLPKKTIGDDSENWTDELWIRSSNALKFPFYNWNWKASGPDIEQYTISIWDKDDVLIFRADMGFPPSVIGTGVVYNLIVDDNNREYQVYTHAGYYRWDMDYDDEFPYVRPGRWYLKVIQGQNNLVTGDDIRVWQDDWSILKTKGSTLITATEGQLGKMGSSNYLGGDP